MPPRSRRLLVAMVETWGRLLLLLFCAGCGNRGETASVVMLRVEGSDTMVNIAQAWAERYKRRRPNVSVQVLGGGSGVGIASLIDGNCDLANTSRKMKPDEIEAVRRHHHGVEPREFIVGYDALAVYVHPKNPLDAISMEELADLYGEEGNLTEWPQLGVPSGALGTDKIIRVNRQSSSGTYVYFREAVLGKGKDMKLGSVDANGSKDAVSLIAHTPAAIGYSGMGYAVGNVKMLRVSKRRGGAAAAPTMENAQNGTYPITRPLQIYVLGDPAGEIKAYLDWILSPEGQEIVVQLGYVPVANMTTTP